MTLEYESSWRKDYVVIWYCDRRLHIWLFDYDQKPYIFFLIEPTFYEDVLQVYKKLLFAVFWAENLSMNSGGMLIVHVNSVNNGVCSPVPPGLVRFKAKNILNQSDSTK